MKPTIFISHASEDGAIANLIEQSILKRHPGVFDVFNTSDETTLTPGCHWKDKITDAVKGSLLMCVLLTEDSNQKPWVYWEAGGAYHLGVKVMPLVGPDLPISELQVLFSDIQAVRLLSKEHLCRMMKEIDAVSRRRRIPSFDPDELLGRLSNAFNRVDSSGKGWLEAAKPRILKFLQSIPKGESRIVRVISYTGETTSKTLSRLIAEHKKPGTGLEIEVLVRSEYNGFVSRPFDVNFNRVIRWRIARAKADWYRLTDYKKSREGVTLHIRDYGWDPMPKFLILGESGGFFGQYAIDGHHVLSGDPDIGAARDWVSESTDMVYVGANQSSYLRAQIKWFSAMWAQATERTNEAYRIKRSDSLWELLKEKDDSHARDLLYRLAPPKGRLDHPHVGNMTLPRQCSETSGDFIEVIGCGVIEHITKKAVIICEIRDAKDSWEGAGKTRAYLSLIGISSNLDLPLRGEGNWRSALLDAIARASIQLKAKAAKFDLFGSDFLWASVREHRLVLSPPEGELAFGLWDITRHLLRKKLEELNQWEDGLHRKLNDHQTLLFKKLNLGDLVARYTSPSVRDVEPDLIFILERCQHKQLQEQIVGENAIRNVLKRLLRSGPFHKSHFWTRTPGEIERLNGAAEKLVDSIDPHDFPRIVHVTGNTPFDLNPSFVKEWLTKAKTV
jgi:hypothetical protein